jgi:hypothetical protein
MDFILKIIEDEFLSMANKARQYLKDSNTEKESQDDFRRCFIQMGAVMVQLPMFKGFTRRVFTSSILVGVRNCRKATGSSEWASSPPAPVNSTCRRMFACFHVLDTKSAAVFRRKGLEEKVVREGTIC